MLAKRHRQPTRLPANRPGPRTQRTADRRTGRRGITLVEMLVTVAVLVIMMTIIVQIFQAATGSVTAAQAFAQIDDQLRRVDTILRGDLGGATAQFTPPMDPLQNRGYFELGENEFADNQGEDSDDYLRFTAKAPVGRPFTGRLWVNYFAAPGGTGGGYLNLSNQPQPITITSEYAEVIYFVRNGNLYRRVFLIVPEMQSAIRQALNNFDLGYQSNYYPSIFSGGAPTQVSWLGMNDLSARPSSTGNSAYAIVLNTLGDLTQRENRAFMPRSCTDFLSASSGYSLGQDGIPDDVNGDNNPDLYPSLYPQILSSSNPLVFAPPFAGTTGAQVMAQNPGFQYLAFPYVYPGAYSQPQKLSSSAYGWIHSPSPEAIVPTVPTSNPLSPSGSLVGFETGGLNYLNNINHNPIEVGDNLPVPSTEWSVSGGNASSTWQTWWGFPTWRETLSPNWMDPTWPLIHTVGGKPQVQGQPPGLDYAGTMNVANGQVYPTSTHLLPPMADPTNSFGDFSIFRQVQQPFSDGLGANSMLWGAPGTNNFSIWSQSWEDDLILTNVRSFDVKVYDIALANYADLGWGDDLRLYQPYLAMGGTTSATPPYIHGNAYIPAMGGVAIAWPPINSPTTPVYPLFQTFAHEGRMPPLVEDNRRDYQNPNPYYYGYNNYVPQYPAIPSYSSNIGDDNPALVRLRRVWDSWSLEYSNAPATGVTAATGGGFPVGPFNGSPPVYPSYPAPYPAPLRGIQIQIRVTDPTNQRIKSLTIRQDFTDKL